MDFHGTLQLTSYFFDEKEPLYKIMLPREKFVPAKFWKLFEDEMSLRRLLMDLGMKHTVSDMEIIEFAHTIESEARGKTSVEELRRKSSALFKEALEYNVTNKESEKDGDRARKMNLKKTEQQQTEGERNKRIGVSRAELRRETGSFFHPGLVS